jgi:dolichol-phosphate mannosyltransferase
MGFRNNIAATGIRKIYSYVNNRRSIIVKFLIVSGSAVAINLLLLFLLVNYAGMSSPLGQNAANVISMELSIIYNYFLSRSITWRNRRQEKGARLFKQILTFHITIGITILFRLGLFAGLQLTGIHYIINASIGIAISALFNFFVYDAYIFKKEES